PQRLQPDAERFGAKGSLFPPTYSGLAPEKRTTLAHFSVSSTTSLPNSAGEPESGVRPKSARRALMSGSASAAPISLLSVSMISWGVFLGAPMPFHPLAS